MAREVVPEGAPRLGDYAAVAHLAPAVRELEAEAALCSPRLSDRTVWMVNSTEQGGGVAEMLPSMISLLTELGVRTRWLVIEAEDEAFFVLTKKLHNLIHGVGDPALTEEDRALFERVNRRNAERIRELVRPGDLVVVHDPQPMPLAGMLADAGVTAVWRCHIGLDAHLPQTEAAWAFLAPYGAPYAAAVFSAPEYIPEFFSHRASLIFPAINPLTDKNRELGLHQLVGTLANSGLAVSPGPVLTPPYESIAQRLQPDGRWAPADAAEDIGLLTRPIVTQISRWDRLKGWRPLLDAFVELKRRIPENGARDPLHRRRLELARLVLAGPDPDSIADDPEGLGVLRDLSEAFLGLPAELQRDIALITLPMRSLSRNALMVNALQRASTVVVQNSLREGFGLTVTEAMWKRVPVLTNRRACGPRQQVRDGLDGRLVDDPEDVDELATALDRMLADGPARRAWGRTAQRRAHDEFLIFAQVRRWIHLLAGLRAPPGAGPRPR